MELLEASATKVVQSGAGGQALEAAGEAGGVNPSSDLAQMWKCCHSPRPAASGDFEKCLIYR